MTLLKNHTKKREGEIPSRNPYAQALYSEYKDWAMDFSKALSFKGRWRELFSKDPSVPLHLEIGPGNGKHFEKLCLRSPEECFLSMEIKYKPLIQTLRKVRKHGLQNARMLYANAREIGRLFEKGELNNVYIHFPDPWLKKRRQKKHQLIQKKFCESLFRLQRSGSVLELKTDSSAYFNPSVSLFKEAGYTLHKCSLDLYKNQKPEKGFMEGLSQFELLFFQKNIPIKYALFLKI